MKAVIFDFDGVVADTMEDNFRAWSFAFSSFGIDLDRKDFFLLEGMGRHEIAGYFLSKEGMDLKFKDEIVELKESFYIKNNSFQLYPEIPSLLHFLFEKGILLSLVSGASKNRIHKFLPAEIHKLFKVIITSDDVLRTKPFPDPYLKAIQLLSLNPLDCIVIENAVLGIKSAKAAGCNCFAVESTLNKKDLHIADKIFSSHSELKKFFISYI